MSSALLDQPATAPQRALAPVDGSVDGLEVIPAFGLVSSGDLERHLPLRDLLATDRWLFATPTDDALVQHLARGSEVMQLRTSTQALRLDPDAVASCASATSATSSVGA